jgi:hypothetical protein
MASQKDRTETDRRGFLKLAGLGTVAGGVALVAGEGTAKAATAKSSKGLGYRETEHVKTFYETARF